MKGKLSYAATDVDQLDVPALVQRVEVGVIVAIDVAKTKLVAAIATDAGEVLKLVRFEHPRQTAAFLGVLQALQQAERKPVVVMEPTGTYGDALRYQCHGLGLPVHMMPPKHSHDLPRCSTGFPACMTPRRRQCWRGFKRSSLRPRGSRRARHDVICEPGWISVIR